jgi:hypothetical protein
MTKNSLAIEHFVLPTCFTYDPQQVRREFKEAVAPAGEAFVPVISHESLSCVPEAGRYLDGPIVAERLHAAFPEARILMVIREQRSMLLSIYRQYLSGGGGEWPIEVFLGTGREPPGFRAILRLEYLEYHHMIGLYQRFFGRDRVLALTYEELRRDPRDFERRVHAFSGSAAQVYDEPPPPINVGSGGATLRLLRRLNWLTHPNPLWVVLTPKGTITQRASRRLCDIVNRLVPTSIQRAAEKRIVNYIAGRTHAYYRESNRITAELLGTDLQALGYDA